jgi:hypothetical protein
MIKSKFRIAYILNLIEDSNFFKKTKSIAGAAIKSLGSNSQLTKFDDKSNLIKYIHIIFSPDYFAPVANPCFCLYYSVLKSIKSMLITGYNLSKKVDWQQFHFKISKRPETHRKKYSKNYALPCAKPRLACQKGAGIVFYNIFICGLFLASFLLAASLPYFCSFAEDLKPTLKTELQSEKKLEIAQNLENNEADFNNFDNFDSGQNSKQNPEQNLVATSDKIDQSLFYDIAIIQALNKITAKTSVLKIKTGEKTEFGQISIIAHKCWQAPPDQRPESKILLEVLQNKTDEVSKRIFYGWLFASSPSISGLEHPIYDLTALSCKK